MNTLFALLALSPLFAPANDNNTIDAAVCVACASHGAAVESLCDACDADMAEHYSALYSDDEVACYEAGIDTDPRY
jgi:hypothetical protein